ncbi:MAG: glycosyltransferase family 2 protein [Dehalococcoidia bacterium]|nr:glycosyltransferase family 2 protein [Dehalococcoidia bacterium]
MKASVIIPNYNGMAHLPTCLTALARQTETDFEVIVVDNNSTDDSRAFIATAFPTTRVLHLQRNRSFFSGAVNAGIAIARGDVIVLLNNDTEAEPTWLAELLAALDAAPDAGMATSKLLLFDRRHVIHSTGDLYRRDGRPDNRGVWEEDHGQYDDAIDVFGGCGGALALRRSMLAEVGLFDEDFIGYCEDVDLSFRAQLLGYRCVFAPRARVYHRLSATGGGPRASYLCGRNFINVIVKDMPTPLLRRYGARIVWAQARLAWRALRHAREPAGRAWLFGQLAALRDLPVMLAKRRHIQASRRAPLATLDARLTG